MNRVQPRWTVDSELVVLLAQRACETGESQSRLVDQALRMLLALPAPEREESTQRGMSLPAKRAWAAMHEPEDVEWVTVPVMKREPIPGARFGAEIAHLTGDSVAVTERALRDLAREGRLFRWGDAQQDSDGQQYHSVWGLRPALEVAADILADPKTVAHPCYGIAVRCALSEIALGMTTADVEKVREMMRVAVRARYAGDARNSEYALLDLNKWHDCRPAIENYAQREARQSAEYAAESAARSLAIREEWKAADRRNSELAAAQREYEAGV